MQRYGAFLWSGDVLLALGDAEDARARRHQHRTLRHSVLGHRHRRLRADRRIHRRAARALVPVRRVLPVVPRARPQLASAAAVGLEHAATVGPSELRGYTGGAADPDPKELNNPQVEPICSKYLELRYRLMPYIYTAARECCDTGLPMMRALWLHYPDDPAAVARGDQFLLGPRHARRAGRREGRDSRGGCICRAGTWFDFWTEQNASTAAARSIARSISRRCRSTCAPARSFRWDRSSSTSTSRSTVRSRSSSIRAPTARPRSTKTTAGASTTGRAQFMRMAMTWRDAGRRLTLTLAPGSRMLPPGTRNDRGRHGRSDRGKTVTFSGKPVEVRL